MRNHDQINMSYTLNIQRCKGVWVVVLTFSISPLQPTTMSDSSSTSDTTIPTTTTTDKPDTNINNNNTNNKKNTNPNNNKSAKNRNSNTAEKKKLKLLMLHGYYQSGPHITSEDGLLSVCTIREYHVIKYSINSSWSFFLTVFVLITRKIVKGFVDFGP